MVTTIIHFLQGARPNDKLMQVMQNEGKQYGPGAGLAICCMSLSFVICSSAFGFRGMRGRGETWS